jgi:type I restriction-modification system DNA methylase subunit
MSVCALSGGKMEEEYLEVAKRYSEGDPRPIDSFPVAFAALIESMESTRRDILGDIFEGAITHGENGQFFTPEHVCQLMAKMTMNEDEAGKTICDPCCGSGRNLLAAADVNRRNEFVGQDVDLRCVRMTALNLSLRNLYGWVVWGDSLRMEQRLIYRTGFNGSGVIAKVDPPDVPEPVRQRIEKMPSGGSQLTLF